MSLSLLTDRAAVIDAITEYDLVGREAFLVKYGFGSSRSYFLEFEGRSYDSKAVAGVVVGKEHPERGPLSPGEFSGGESTVRAKLESLGFRVVSDGSEMISISSADVEILRRAHASGKLYAALSDEERAAYVNITDVLQKLGNAVVGRLGSGYTLKLTSGFHVQSGVRGSQPKDLWFGIFPTENTDTFVGNPQLFLIVSGRGIEFGFAASTHPSDFSNGEIKQKVREAAPHVFSQLPEPGDRLARELSDGLLGRNWAYRKKGRLDPGQTDFPSLDAWLTFMHSEAGFRAAGGCISCYVVGEDIDRINLGAELIAMTDVFRPLMETIRPGAPVQATERVSPSHIFAESMNEAMDEFARVREEPFGRVEPMWSLLEKVVSSVEALQSVRSRPHIKVSASLGQGNWVRVPWIALLNQNITTSTQSGLYVVFLISKDLQRIYLTLNQGVTELIEQLGPREGSRVLTERAGAYRERVADLASAGYTLDNNIDLASDGRLPTNYKQGTIAFVEFAVGALPSDAELEVLLEALLASYDRLAQESAVAHVLEPAQEKADIANHSPPFTLDDAMEGLFMDRGQFERILHTWRIKKNLVLQGAPGVGKSFVARRLAYTLMGLKDPSRVEAVQFHQSYGYEDFIQGYRPDGSGGFARNDGVFLRFCRRAIADPGREYVFIIDEINRGNLSKILGELMLLIEHDKRSSEWAVQLTYSREGEPTFHIPDNVYIIGMMNTADRSLSLVDYALRRRFAFATLDPCFASSAFSTHLLSCGIPQRVADRVVERMQGLNAVIAGDQANLGRGYQIGHSFFVPGAAVSSPDNWYRGVVETEIVPLLEEYWFDDPDKVDHWSERLLDGAP